MWGTIFSIALKLVGWMIEKKASKDEAKKKFLELLDAVKDDAAISVKIKDSLTSQREALKKRLEEQKSGQQPPLKG